MNKLCTKCNKIKYLDEFSFNKFHSSYRSQCKKCRAVYQNKYRKNNITIWSDWYSNNRDKRLEYHKEYNINNKDVVAKKDKKYYDKHKSEIIKRHIKYNNKRNKIDIKFNLSNKLRWRLNRAIKGNYKSGSAVSDLGCSIEFLKQYLESKFKDGMSWSNYGQWHIDHIYPLSKVDLTDRDQFLKACNYSNLQPMWAKDNISKGNKILKGDLYERQI